MAWVRANSFLNERALTHNQPVAPIMSRHWVPKAIAKGTIPYCAASIGSSLISEKAFEIKCFRYLLQCNYRAWYRPGKTGNELIMKLAMKVMMHSATHRWATRTVQCTSCQRNQACHREPSTCPPAACALAQSPTHLHDLRNHVAAWCVVYRNALVFNIA